VTFHSQKPFEPWFGPVGWKSLGRAREVIVPYGCPTVSESFFRITSNLDCYANMIKEAGLTVDEFIDLL